MAPWKTETVTALLDGIFKESAWDRYPILADALEDAGYDNTPVLNAFRTDDVWAYLFDRRCVDRLITGRVTPVEVAYAYAFLSRFTIDLRCDYTRNAEEFTPILLRSDDPAVRIGWLFDVCDDYVAHADIFIFRGYDTPRVCYEQVDEMWAAYRLMTGGVAPNPSEHAYDVVPFSCSC